MSDLRLSFTLKAPPLRTTTSERCDHSFCSHCMSSYIVEKIDNGVVNVRCPGLNCEVMLDPLTCKPLVPRGYCPNLSCREMIINECGGGSCNRSGHFQDDNNRLLERLAERQRWKRSANSKIYVERRGGCTKMMCRYVNFFCLPP
ncbi:hypothetical protein EUGRSUZ_A00218 [Eucalyptus grandis]|uniref:Uncharacterized protein n=2 Tax=Eucalyptus grandis TaxID=71139 RepID=A0ACC3LYL1_EUCGR|nr:hypothetical protein EUGRSUZ_A00218 [Eucalyptus grandis]